MYSETIEKIKSIKRDCVKDYIIDNSKDIDFSNVKRTIELICNGNEMYEIYDKLGYKIFGKDDIYEKVYKLTDVNIYRKIELLQKYGCKYDFDNLLKEDSLPTKYYPKSIIKKYENESWKYPIYRFDGNIKVYQDKYCDFIIDKMNINYDNECVLNLIIYNFKHIINFAQKLFKNEIQNKFIVDKPIIKLDFEKAYQNFDVIKFAKDIGIEDIELFKKSCLINDKLVVGPKISTVIFEAFVKKLVYDYFKLDYHEQIKDTFIKNNIVITWFVDDILIIGDSANDFKQYIELEIQKYNLKLNEKKTYYYKDTIRYIGYYYGESFKKFHDKYTELPKSYIINKGFMGDDIKILNLK